MPSTPPNTSLQTPQPSWPLVRLGDFTTKIGSGSTPRGGEAVYVKKGVPLIRSMNVHFDGLRPGGLAFITKAEAEKLKNMTVQEGDVLLNITGASIGRVTTVPGELAGARVNQHVCIIRPTAALNPKFLAYFFATPVEQMRINECQVGATRQALTKQMIEDWQVPLPPLEEQQRVVAEIEKQFTRLEVGLAALRRVQANLKRYRAAVLKAACEGHLVPTEAELARAEGLPFESGQQLLARILIERHQNWKGRGRYEEPEPPDTEGLPALPEGWAYATVEQLGIVGEQAVLTGPFGTNLTSADFTDSGVPVLTISCLKDTGIKMEKADFVSENKAIELERYRLAPGDLLFSRMASVGRAGIVGESLRGALFNYHIMRLRLEPSVLLAKFYLAYVRGASQVEQYLKKVNHGATRAGINTEQLLHMPVVLPPLAEQTRIVPEVERRLSVVEELEAVVTTNLERAKRLRGSILAGGFRSERGADKGPLQSKVKPAPSRQTDQPIRQIISSMKNNLKLSPEALVETVRRNKGRMTPAELCLASHVEEEVEGFFEVLRECRDQGLLVVPSGIGGIIKLAKS